MMTLDPKEWEEVSPCIYQRKTPYTPEQIERLNRRPTELINAALKGASAFTPALCAPVEKTRDNQ